MSKGTTNTLLLFLLLENEYETHQNAILVQA
jgi:hypothetical protein